MKLVAETADSSSTEVVAEMITVCWCCNSGSDAKQRIVGVAMKAVVVVVDVVTVNIVDDKAVCLSRLLFLSDVVI